MSFPSPRNATHRPATHGGLQKGLRHGLNCPDLPEEYGGMGISYLTGAVIREELSRGDAAFPLRLCHSLGMKPSSSREPSTEAAGGGHSSFGRVFLLRATEPDRARTRACTTTAVKVGDEYVLNGRKCFITNRPTPIS
jgi:butyryl-CoA dehydrogenase